MRISKFELDVKFVEILTMPQVCSGRGMLIKNVRLRNVRGDSNDWIKLSISVGKWHSDEKSIRDLNVDDEVQAVKEENRILSGFVLPSSFLSGIYHCILYITHEFGKKEVPFKLQVLDWSFIKIDLESAAQIASYVETHDLDLRTFANKIDASGIGYCQALYKEISLKALSYLSVPTILYEDIQKVNRMQYVFRDGGSCAEISLLMASIMWMKGLSPLLIEFQSHMAVGCLFATKLHFETLRNQDEALKLISKGDLVFFDSVGVCAGMAWNFEAAQERVTRFIRQGEAFCIVNVKEVLRNGMVPIPALNTTRLVCPNCGWISECTESMEESVELCSACGFRFPQWGHTQVQVIEPFGDVVCSTDGTTAKVVSANKTATAIRLNSTYQNCPVSEIADKAFSGYSMETIFIPEGLVSIGRNAFAGCSHLRSIRLPFSLKELCSGAFMQCAALESITIPGSVKRIEPHTFFRCSSLQNVILENGIEEICDFAFEGCESLQTLILPASIKTVSRKAFADCPGLKVMRWAEHP